MDMMCLNVLTVNQNSPLQAPGGYSDSNELPCIILIKLNQGYTTLHTYEMRIENNVERLTFVVSYYYCSGIPSYRNSSEIKMNHAISLKFHMGLRPLYPHTTNSKLNWKNQCNHRYILSITKKTCYHTMEKLDLHCLIWVLIKS